MKIKRLIGLLLVTVLLFTMVPMSTLAKPADNDMSSTVKTSDISSDNPTSDESANDLASYVNGIVKCPDGRWAMYKNGKVDTTCTTIAMNQYGWWRVKDGYVDFNANGIYKNQFGWWKTNAGKVTFKETGIYKNEYGWWRVVNSKVDFKANGIYKNSYGWWKTTNGKVTFDETGVFQNQFGWWYVNNSKVDFNFTGIASNNFGKWYIKTGKVDFTKIGKAEYNGNTYLVMFGKALQITDNKEKVTVTFIANADNVTNMPKPLKVNINEPVSEPASPIKDGYVFLGWFVDANGTDKYNFALPVEGDMVLYAKWIVESEELIDKVIDKEDIETLSDEGVLDVIYADDGSVLTVDGKFTEKRVLNEEDASEVLNSAKPLFGEVFYSTKEDIASQTAEIDNEQAGTYYRYSPTKNGISVVGSQIVLSTDKDGIVTGLFNSYDSGIDDISTTPVLSMRDAEQFAVERFMEEESVKEFLDYTTDTLNMDAEETIDLIKTSLDVKSDLIILSLREFIEPKLAYSVKVSAKLSLLENDAYIHGLDANETFYISAIDESESLLLTIDNNEGIVLSGKDVLNQTRSFEAIEQGNYYELRDNHRNLETYYATLKFVKMDLAKWVLPGSIVKTNINLPQIGKDAISAHANMSEVYDYYLKYLGRWSFDNKGGKVVSSIMAYPVPNAAWDYDQQLFKFMNSYTGSMFCGSLDTCAHEYTHAVINYVVGDGHSKTLVYAGEPGALNESYADIMACLIEGKTGKDKWLINEDVKAIRNMANPSEFGQPNHYKNKYTGYNVDNGGVHINSGIFNYAAYLMMTDSRTDNISNESWAKLFYHSMYKLTTTSHFLQARGAIIATAKEQGLDGNQIQAIIDAFDAVGIRDYSDQQVPDNDTHTDAIFDDFQFWSDLHPEPLPLSSYYVSSDGINDYYKYPKPINYSYIKTDTVNSETYYFIGTTYVVHDAANISDIREALYKLDDNTTAGYYANGGIYVTDLGKWYRYTIQIKKRKEIIKVVNIDFMVDEDTETKLISSEGTSLKVGSPTQLTVVNEIEPYKNYDYVFYAINEDTQLKQNISSSYYNDCRGEYDITWVPEKAGNYTLYVSIIVHDGLPKRTLKLTNVVVKDST